MTGRDDLAPDRRPSPEFALRLARARRHAEAEEAFGAWIAAHPGDADALAHAGTAALAAGRTAVAVRRFEQLAALHPDSAQARTSLGDALVRAGRPVDAIFHLERAVRLDPGSAATHFRLGVAFERVGDRTNAIRSLESALALEPRHADAAAFLGNAHNRRGDTVRSREAFGRALATDASHPGARTGLAFAEAIEGDLGGARAKLEAMAAEAPEGSAFWVALGKLRAWSGDLDAAGDAYRQAAARDPTDVDAQYGIAAALLGRGQWAEGWRALEERPEGRFGEARRLPRLPVWSGATLDGPLLVLCEGSLSDTVQFARFLRAARTRAAELAVLADGYWAPLAPLLATAAGVDDVLKDAAQVGALRALPKARVGLQSLAYHLGVTLDSLPAQMPYLAAPRDRSAVWRSRLGASDVRRVGLVWSARGDRGALSRHKSVPLPTLARVLATPGVEFVSLQVGAMGALAGASELAPRVADFSREIRDFGDTAAIVDALDLVISVDTSVAHVAGAMGKPVWLLDRFHTSWRWRALPGHSPWYPSLRIFRQHRFLDWSHAIAAVAAALAAFAADGTLPP